jgi:hypothetical protein
MGDQPVDGEKSQPSLELPSLFRRRNKDRRSSPPADQRPADERTEATPRLDDPTPDGPTGTAPADAEAQPEHTQSLAPRAAQPSADPWPEAEPAQPEARPAGSRRAARRAERRTERRTRRSRTRPVLPPVVAAVLTGLLVGLFGALLTWGSLIGCDVVRGTKSCGGPGLLLLVVIVALMVVVGALLLRLFKVPEPRSTSFLAVGLTAVIVLVTLMEELFSRWMFVAVPLVSAATFALAGWVTTRYVELPENAPEHDIR